MLSTSLTIDLLLSRLSGSSFPLAFPVVPGMTDDLPIVFHVALSISSPALSFHSSLVGHLVFDRPLISLSFPWYIIDTFLSLCYSTLIITCPYQFNQLSSHARTNSINSHHHMPIPIQSTLITCPYQFNQLSSSHARTDSINSHQVMPVPIQSTLIITCPYQLNQLSSSHARTNSINSHHMPVPIQSSLITCPYQFNQLSSSHARINSINSHHHMPVPIQSSLIITCPYQFNQLSSHARTNSAGTRLSLSTPTSSCIPIRSYRTIHSG